jgi:membrane-associated phospholipid phosphatase
MSSRRTNFVTLGLVATVDEWVVERIGIRARTSDRIAVIAEPRFVALEAIGLAALPGLRPRERVMLLVAPVLSGLVGHALKRAFPRERPSKTRFTPQGGESFPSTHAANGTALLLAAARVAAGHGMGGWVYAVAGTSAALIAVARIRGGAHWPTDVLAGTFIGVTAAASAAALAGDR